MYIRKSTAAIGLFWIIGLALMLVAHSSLPERYYFDAESIKRLIDDPQLEFAESFRRTAFAWRLFGFGTLWPDQLAGAFGHTVAIAAIAWAVRMARVDWKPAIFVLLAAWCIPVAIYHGQYSKEMFAILIVVAVLRLSTSAAGVIAAAMVALGYALIMRTYWVAVVFLWLVLIAGWRGGLSWPWRLLLVAIAILPLSTASHELMGFWLSDGRTLAVEGRDLDPDGATVFTNPLDNVSVLSDLANTLAGWLMLVAPFYLLSLGAVQHVGFALFQLLNTALFVAAAQDVGGRSGALASDANTWRYAAATSWCVAYTAVQGMFEPDFGSFVKHQTNLVPMLAYIFLSARSAARTRADDATDR